MADRQTPIQTDMHIKNQIATCSSTHLTVEDHDAVVKVMVLHGGCPVEQCQRRGRPEKKSTAIKPLYKNIFKVYLYPKIFFDMWKGHTLEVHCTNI